jgi:hypothetical protein
MVHVSQFIEMVLSSHHESFFQSSRSHHPNQSHVMMKWLELLHVGEMVL